MISTVNLSKGDSEIISQKIKEEIYKPAFSLKTTIFLCGADISQEDKIRHNVAEALKRHWIYRYYFDIVYPEDIFDELLYSAKSTDLLSLEGLLADSVDAIVIIPESPGSFTELGAFANDERLRKKIICIVDKKYKKNKSFINQGPIKLIKQENNKGVIFIDPKNINEEIDKIISALNKIKKESSKKSDRISLLQLDNFLLPSIYLLEPVTKDTLIDIVSFATNDKINPFQTTTTALNILIKRKQVEITTTGYKLTKKGVEDFLSFRKSRSRIKRQDETVKIDNLRLEIFNYKNRKKKLRV